MCNTCDISLFGLHKVDISPHKNQRVDSIQCMKPFAGIKKPRPV
jgi:hypothetical protein